MGQPVAFVTQRLQSGGGLGLEMRSDVVGDHRHSHLLQGAFEPEDLTLGAVGVKVAGGPVGVLTRGPPPDDL